MAGLHLVSGPMTREYLDQGHARALRRSGVQRRPRVTLIGDRSSSESKTKGPAPHLVGGGTRRGSLGPGRLGPAVARWRSH